MEIIKEENVYSSLENNVRIEFPFLNFSLSPTGALTTRNFDTRSRANDLSIRLKYLVAEFNLLRKQKNKQESIDRMYIKQNSEVYSQ